MLTMSGLDFIRFVRVALLSVLSLVPMAMRALAQAQGHRRAVLLSPRASCTRGR
jgi:hypothetical protein